MKNHSIWMILLCVLPMLLIVILPAMGVEIGAFWLLLPLFCAGSHLLMMRGHHHGDHGIPHGHHEGKEEES
jgi:hypothetical protein